MAFLKKSLAVIFCLTLSLAITSCGKKDELNLPEVERKQLSAASGTSRTSEEKPSKCDFVEGKKFYVYAEKGYFKNHFAPSGWMGDYGDIKFVDNYKVDPYSRRSCIRVVYTAENKQGAGWAGIYWQHPPNNWGNMPGGYNLDGAKKLTFYAKGEKGGELITEIKMGGISGQYSDTTSYSIGPLILTPEWKEYTVNLEGEDLSSVIGGFAFVVSSMENPEGATFYIDEIAYE